MRDRLARLAEAVDQPRTAVEGHGYRLNPVADDATVARAERAIGGPLPAGYRRFVTTIGDGGAGPYWGVLPLAEALSWVEGRFGDLEALGRDCPLDGDLDFGELLGHPVAGGDHGSGPGVGADDDAAFERLAEIYRGDPWSDGRLPIVEYGCGDWFFLVVRGPARGTVGVDSVDGGTGLYDLRVDFPTFYQRWLDAEVARVLEGRAERLAHYAYLEFGDNPRYRPV